MTNHVARLYALALALVVFFVTWAAVAAQPWATAKPDPRVTALAAREQKLRREATLVRRVVGRRLADHRVALDRRQAEIAAAQASRAQAPASLRTPAAVAQAAALPVRIVNLPPLDDHQDVMISAKSSARWAPRSSCCSTPSPVPSPRPPSRPPGPSSSGSRRSSPASGRTPSSPG